MTTRTYRFNDPRLPIDATSPTHLGRHRVSDDPYGDALVILRHWHRIGRIHLERRHVVAAARITGADFGLLWDMILSPATVTS